MCYNIFIRPFVSVLLLLAAVSVLAQPGDQGWALQRDENGISVYTRNIDGNVFDEYKAVTIVYNIPIDSIYALIVGGQGKRLSEKDPLVKKYEILKINGTEEYYSYMELKTPFLIKDRDLVFRVNSRATSRGYIVEGHSMPAYVPEKPGLVRMGEGRTYYFLTRRDDGGVEVVISGRLDLGGGLPERVVNSSIVDSTYERLMFIRSQIKAIFAGETPEK